MNKRFVSVVLSLGLFSTAILPASAAETSPDDTTTNGQVVFFCGQTFDADSKIKSQVPTTLVWIPEKQGNVALIRWKSQYFERSAWGNKKRCDIASAKFQKLWDAGELNLVTTGKAKNGLPIVCGVANEGDPCTSENQIFTLKPFSDPTLITSQLANIFQGKASSPVYESGGSQPYIAIKGLLQNGQIVSRQSPRKSH